MFNILIGGSIWPFNEHENLRFDNEYDIHMTSNIYENYVLDLDLLIIMH